ncbi:multicopper oxidase family protein [Desertibacillus haloalkaliphilus]|uniref:multicopper oxidase family protein n=1 Tax=Desertibacillus haloalkaliphilus TaxID=1328930 RepID=UPI001C280849|nr:multicopper oxidase family protein [Desertibacillus haloalkaliphilus]MBU8908020.1 multicopper oxidase family protein [Desertibacillus haloalkaliphilus]
MRRKSYLIGLLLAFVLILGACSNDTGTESEGLADVEEEVVEEVASNDSYETEKVFTIEAKEAHWMFNDEIMDDIWTYNGTLPGKEIRVTEGDHVTLHVKNSLPTATAVHLHGFPVPNEMDGVPGVTQNAIMPGEEFMYEYVADTPGTYWYHSHQKGAEQVGRGLYGAFIVEPKDQPAYDLDEIIIIDEWSSMGMDMSHGDMDHSDMNDGHMDHGDMDHSDMNDGHMDHEGMAHGDMNGNGMGHDPEMSHAEMMRLMYDTPLINGKTGVHVEPLVVDEGETVKLRFLNAGLFTQTVTIPGHSYKITHYDGQEVNEPEWISDEALRIAPAERFDVELELDNPGAWGIQVLAEDNRDNLNIAIPLVYAGYENDQLQTADASAYFDFTTYGEPKDIAGNVTKEYDMLLETNDNGETFTINGKKFPDHEIYDVAEGDVVKFTIKNDTDDDHPMHLHGEFFNVISKDGQPIQGSPILKDTLNVRPGETYEIVFEAKNPGNWLFHCHEFHHASGGMVAEIQYEGFEQTFTPDPNVPNQPE